MAKHYFSLLDMKKAFKSAQDYHLHAIQHGNEETKKSHLEHHIKSGNFDILVQKKSASKGK